MGIRNNLLPRYYEEGIIPIPPGYWATAPSDLIQTSGDTDPRYVLDIDRAAGYADEHEKTFGDFSTDEIMQFMPNMDISRGDNDVLNQQIDVLCERLADPQVLLVDKEEDAQILNWLLELRHLRSLSPMQE